MLQLHLGLGNVGALSRLDSRLWHGVALAVRLADSVVLALHTC